MRQMICSRAKIMSPSPIVGQVKFIVLFVVWKMALRMLPNYFWKLQTLTNVALLTLCLHTSPNGFKRCVVWHLQQILQIKVSLQGGLIPKGSLRWHPKMCQWCWGHFLQWYCYLLPGLLEPHCMELYMRIWEGIRFI